MSESPPATTEERREQQAIAFVQKLGGALHEHGTPANRLDDVLQLLSSELGLKANFFSTPSAIFYAYDLPSERGFARLQRLWGHNLDLSKLARLDRLFNAVIDGRKELDEATLEVDRITAAPPPYSRLTTWFAFVLVSSMAAHFFDGGTPEVLLAATAGAMLGTLYFLTRRSEHAQRLFEPLGGAVVSGTTAALASRFGASPDVATLAGLIVLVPGFSLTLGTTELALQHPVSGLARLAGAVMTLLMLSMGVVFGREVGGLLAGAEAWSWNLPTLPPGSETVALLLSGLGLGVLFRAERRDLPFTVVAVLVPYLGFQLGAEQLGLEARVFLGGLLSGVFANLYARWLDRPSLTVRLPGVLILVPGATSFLSFSEISSGDAVEGVTMLFRVGMTLISLVTGLLVSNALVSPRKAL